MAEKRNYLLGKGEVLARNERVKLGFGEGREPYSFGEQKAYLAPVVRAVSASIDALPSLACPHDEAVAVLTLHPKYLSKSAYPHALFEQAGFRSVGSKAVTVTPRKTHLAKSPVPSASAELFIAGKRANFRKFSASLQNWSSSTHGAEDLLKVESFRLASPSEKVRQVSTRNKEVLFEVILHAGLSKEGRGVLAAFREYVEDAGIDIELGDRIDAQELSFLPVRTSKEKLNAIADFAFLRLAREMASIREFSSAANLGSMTTAPFPLQYPASGPIDPSIRVAVFDGGHPDVPVLSKWVKPIDPSDVVAPIPAGLKHGLQVTSALLFGPLQPGKVAPIPYATVDHYRVYDAATKLDPQKALYPVLKRIKKVLEKEQYDFVNFSIGPDDAIEDDDVHPWTAVIDPLLSSGNTLATIAVGNGGEKDAALNYNRIQPPSDCVNALSVGSSDSEGPTWNRAPYSSVGHGRCPGVMKPDGVAFGGITGSLFHVVDHVNSSVAAGTRGTSFSAPMVLRAAVGVRAQLGPVLSGIALKALLIHNCQIGNHQPSEVGWGRFCTDVDTLITSAKGEATIVYQGSLDPKKFLRAAIPMPKALIQSFVTISATLCIATTTDPQHPLTYTKSGMQIFFRKDRKNVPVGKTNPKSTGFFKTGLGLPEWKVRADAHQWETVRHESKRMRGNDLKDPCFDIHLNPREEGHDTDGEEVPYAMIVTVSAPKVPDLFEQIFDRYRFQLQELRPKLQVPIRAKN